MTREELGVLVDKRKKELKNSKFDYCEYFDEYSRNILVLNSSVPSTTSPFPNVDNKSKALSTLTSSSHLQRPFIYEGVC